MYIVDASIINYTDLYKSTFEKIIQILKENHNVIFFGNLREGRVG